jgi:hypothetical protein
MTSSRPKEQQRRRRIAAAAAQRQRGARRESEVLVNSSWCIVAVLWYRVDKKVSSVLEAEIHERISSSCEHRR